MEPKVMEEINQYINEESVRGDLARELAGVVSDFQAGTISAQEKQELVDAIVEGFEIADTADKEQTMRWLVSAASVVSAVV